MAIDKEKLIELLIARTGLGKEKVEEQLAQLVGRIKEAAGEGKSFQIEGLGIFDLNNDTLHFSPADTLKTEINHKYAGMKPIELIGAFKEIPPVGEGKEPQAEETEEEESRVEPEEHEAESVPADTEPEPELQEETSGGPEPSLQDQLQEVFGGEETMESQKLPADSLELDEELLSVAGADTEEPVEEENPGKASFIFDEEQAEEEQEIPPADPDTPGAKKEKKDKDPIGTVLTVCVAVLAVGVIGWLIYDLGLLNTLKSDKQAGHQENQTVQSAAGQPASSVSLRGETDQNGPEQDPANRVTGNNTGSQLSVSDYGLMGKATSRGNNGYTIVIHSLTNKNTSQAIADRLEAQGYRIVLTSAVVNSSVFWRVGLGQFRTVVDAQRAVRTLPERYQNNHFIKRIQ